MNSQVFEKNEILMSNRDFHSLEAEVYDLHHGEIFNSYAQHRTKKVLQESLNKFLNLTKMANLTALDCACGTGNVSEKLLKQKIKIDAVDISSEMLRLYNEKFSNKYADYFRTIESDLDSYLENITPASYQIIAFSSALHHLPDYEATIRKAIVALARPGLLIILHEPLPPNLCSQKYAGRLLMRFDRFVWKYWGKIIRRKPLSGSLKNIRTDLVDFHVGQGGVRPNILQSVIRQAGGEIWDYEQKSENMRHWWSAILDNKFSLRCDNFHLVAAFPV